MPLTRPTMQTSLHGRRFGLDHLGFTVGQPGVRHPYETGAVGTALEYSGVSILAPTTASDYTITDPAIVGVEKTIVNNSTVSVSVTRVSTVTSFAWSTGTDPRGVKITLPLRGSSITMIAVSTAVWLPKSAPGSTAWVSVSTSS